MPMPTAFHLEASDPVIPKTGVPPLAFSFEDEIIAEGSEGVPRTVAVFMLETSKGLKESWLITEEGLRVMARAALTTAEQLREFKIARGEEPAALPSELAAWIEREVEEGVRYTGPIMKSISDTRLRALQEVLQRLPRSYPGADEPDLPLDPLAAELRRMLLSGMLYSDDRITTICARRLAARARAMIGNEPTANEAARK